MVVVQSTFFSHKDPDQEFHIQDGRESVKFFFRMGNELHFFWNVRFIYFFYLVKFEHNFSVELDSEPDFQDG